MKILKGDKIKVLIGKDKGREAEVVAAFPKTGKIIAKGLNIFKKHVKASNGQKGGIVEKERALLASKTILICPNCQKAIRVKYIVTKNGKRERICRKCSSPLTQIKK